MSELLTCLYCGTPLIEDRTASIESFVVIIGTSLWNILMCILPGSHVACYWYNTYYHTCVIVQNMDRIMQEFSMVDSIVDCMTLYDITGNIIEMHAMYIYNYNRKCAYSCNLENI